MESVHLQLPADLKARIDDARGDIPRNTWIRRAIEQRLENAPERAPRSLHYALADAAVRDSAQIKRDIQSRPKGGKR